MCGTRFVPAINHDYDPVPSALDAAHHCMHAGCMRMPPPPRPIHGRAHARSNTPRGRVLFLVCFFRVQGDAYKAFKAVGAKTEDVVFVETTSAEVAKLAGLVEADTVAALKNFEGGWLHACICRAQACVRCCMRGVGSNGLQHGCRWVHACTCQGNNGGRASARWCMPRPAAGPTLPDILQSVVCPQNGGRRAPAR